MKFTTVLFDLDDTLLDGRKTAEIFTHKVINHYKNILDINDTEGFISQLLDENRTLYKERERLFVKLYTRLPWKEKPDVTELLAFWRDEYPLSSVPADGLYATLGYIAKKGIKTALVTNGPTQFQKNKLKTLKINDSFDAVVISEEAGLKKPDASIFELALKKLGERAENAVFVGDNPINDIYGAHNCGIKTLWIRNGIDWPEKGFAPDFTAERIEELFEIL